MVDASRQAAESARIEALLTEVSASEEAVGARLEGRRHVGNRFVAGRLASFTVGVLAFFATVGFADERWAWLGCLPAIAVFVVLVRSHRPVKREIARLERLLDLLARKRTRIEEAAVDPVEDPTLLEPDSPHFAPPPRHWSLAQHVQEDLGLFAGRRHLFGVAAGAASSRLGRLEVSRRLLHSALDAGEISRRSGAAKTLLAAKRTRHDLEQVFAELGPRAPSDAALAFAGAGDLAIPDEGRLRLLAPVTALNAGLLTAAVFLEANLALLGLMLLSAIGARLFRRAAARTVPVRGGFGILAGTLRAMQDADRILAADETVTGDEELRSIGERIARLVRRDGGVALPLRKLAALGFYKAGLVYVVVNWITFWDLHHVVPLARWGRRRREALLDALDALGRLEAAAAFASLAEEQRGWCWPEPTAAERPRLRLEEVRHPALRSAVAVTNSIDLEGGRGVCVLTGSNMTGKSTFLKACGSALVLAQAGAPAAARSMDFTPLRLYSDVNVRDSLDDGRSYFAVEVGRIKEVVSAAEDDPFLLALLDEMFRGTNTHEKVAAGIEVTRWLAEREVLALVATHDHELTKLAVELPCGRIRNYHFTERLRDGAMTFDYVLHEGPATSRNALRVLALEGFPESVVTRAIERSEGNGRHE